MNTEQLMVIDIARKAAVNKVHTNIPVATINDNVVRMSVMTEPYFWLFHPNSDETFLVMEGSVFIDLEDRHR